MEHSINYALTFALLPAIALLGIVLNVCIRARGGRSFSFRLKGFGIDMVIETRGVSSSRRPADEAESFD